MPRRQTSEEELAKAIRLCLQKGIPFFVYRKPDSSGFDFGAQSDSAVSEFGGFSAPIPVPGFVFSPFDAAGRLPAWFLRGDIRLTGDDSWERLHALSTAGCRLRSDENAETSYGDYKIQAASLVEACRSGAVRKVVLSRPLTIPGSIVGRVPELFLQTASKYPAALVSLVYVPGRELWLGASPEILLSVRDGEAETMALAGTKRSDDGSDWGEKEREEQQIVADSITEVLTRLSGELPEKSDVFTRRAGNVSHLCTRFRCRVDAGKIDALLQELHPTPAVGGFPKEEAMQWIRRTEHYNRRYYAGYCGPVSDAGTFSLFVNLRCMEFLDNSTRLYVGGGITAASCPESEWDETVLKSQTLLDLIK